MNQFTELIIPLQQLYKYEKKFKLENKNKDKKFRIDKFHSKELNFDGIDVSTKNGLSLDFPSINGNPQLNFLGIPTRIIAAGRFSSFTRSSIYGKNRVNRLGLGLIVFQELSNLELSTNYEEKEKNNIHHNHKVISIDYGYFKENFSKNIAKKYCIKWNNEDDKAWNNIRSIMKDKVIKFNDAVIGKHSNGNGMSSKIPWWCPDCKLPDYDLLITNVEQRLKLKSSTNEAIKPSDDLFKFVKEKLLRKKSGGRGIYSVEDASSNI